MRGLWNEMRLALRMLSRSPWLTVTAVLMLALGLGCVGAMLSVIKGVVLRPFPYFKPAEIVMIWNNWQDFPKTWVSIPEFRTYRKQTKSFADIGLFWTDGVNLASQGEAQRLNAGFVSPNIFQVLGVGPILGRTFTWEEATPGRGEVVILGQGLWQRQYGGDRSILGSSVEINGAKKTVIGIMPASFKLPLDFNTQASELWLPQPMDMNGAILIPRGGGDHSYYTVGRLKPGVTAERAGSEMRALGERLTVEGTYPQAWHFSPLVVPLLDDILGSTRWALGIVLVAVALVLFIACANVALLLLARGNQRRRELALRAALGALRTSLVRHLLMESVALAALGWLVGLVLAQLALAQLVRALSPNVPRIGEVTLDTGVMAAMALVSLVTALLVGLPPSLHHSVVDPQLELKEGGRTPVLSAGLRRSQAALVAAEIALAMILIVGMGLMVRSFWNLLQVDVGFHAKNVLTLSLSPSTLKEADGARVPQFYHELLARLDEVPGVERAAAVRVLPLASPIGDWGIAVEGYQPAAGERVKGDWQLVSPGYFEVMGIPLKRGRTFRESDTGESLPVIIVNETMAHKFWPNGDSLGKRIKVSGAADSPWSIVVGVVGDVRHNGVTAEVKEQWYLPDTQFHLSTGIAVPAMTLVIKTKVPPAQVAGSIREAIRAFDPKLPVANVEDIDQVLARAFSQPRSTMLLMILAAALALALAVIGAYGVVGYGVSQRTHEIGLRMALGAEPRKVMAMIIGQGLTIVALGIVLGGVTAEVVMRFLASLLYGVSAHDPLIYLCGALLLLLVASGASFLPARRAARIDPAIALRGQ